MAAKTEEEFLKREKPVKLVVGVAVDGSTLSDRALATACSCVQEQRGDRLVLLHVADSAKTYLPRHLQPRHLENTYTSKAFDLRVRSVLVCPFLHCCRTPHAWGVRVVCARARRCRGRSGRAWTRAAAARARR
jgi:hypothetical protein